jgi:hypothetical protein
VNEVEAIDHRLGEGLRLEDFNVQLSVFISLSILLVQHKVQENAVRHVTNCRYYLCMTALPAFFSASVFISTEPGGGAETRSSNVSQGKTKKQSQNIVA